MNNINIAKNYYFYLKDREPQALYLISAMTKNEAMEKIDKIHTENDCEGFKTAERMKLIYSGYSERELGEKIDKKIKGVWNGQISIANLNIYRTDNKNDCIYLIDTNGQPTIADYGRYIDFLKMKIQTVKLEIIKCTNNDITKKWKKLLKGFELDLAKYTALQNNN